MAFMYYLPDENGKREEYGTSANAVIISGANGSGKSKLGAWIEQQSMQNVHRIGAQRKLNFSENIQKGKRWNYGKAFTTTLIDDFNDVLAAL